LYMPIENKKYMVGYMNRYDTDEQGRRHEFEGGGSMHWKVGGQYSKITNI